MTTVNMRVSVMMLIEYSQFYFKTLTISSQEYNRLKHLREINKINIRLIFKKCIYTSSLSTIYN